MFLIFRLRFRRLFVFPLPSLLPLLLCPSPVLWRPLGVKDVVVLAVAVYFLAFFPSVMREETDFIAKKFPEEHAAWAAEVPAFWPRLTPGGSRSSHFDCSRVSMNREWRTVVALPLIAILLYARTLLGL